MFAESSRFRFAPRRAIWFGQMMMVCGCDTTGNAVFGFYGGEATGYTWGGALLDPGDILFGRGSQYMLWDTSSGQTHRIRRNAGRHGDQRFYAQRLAYLGYR